MSGVFTWISIGRPPSPYIEPVNASPLEYGHTRDIKPDIVKVEVEEQPQDLYGYGTDDAWPGELDVKAEPGEIEGDEEEEEEEEIEVLDGMKDAAALDETAVDSGSAAALPALTAGEGTAADSANDSLTPLPEEAGPAVDATLPKEAVPVVQATYNSTQAAIDATARPQLQSAEGFRQPALRVLPNFRATDTWKLCRKIVDQNGQRSSQSHYLVRRIGALLDDESVIWAEVVDALDNGICGAASCKKDGMACVVPLSGDGELAVRSGCIICAIYKKGCDLKLSHPKRKDPDTRSQPIRTGRRPQDTLGKRARRLPTSSSLAEPPYGPKDSLFAAMSVAFSRHPSYTRDTSSNPFDLFDHALANQSRLDVTCMQVCPKPRLPEPPALAQKSPTQDAIAGPSRQRRDPTAAPAGVVNAEASAATHILSATADTASLSAEGKRKRQSSGAGTEDTEEQAGARPAKWPTREGVAPVRAVDLRVNTEASSAALVDAGAHANATQSSTCEDHKAADTDSQLSVDAALVASPTIHIDPSLDDQASEIDRALSGPTNKEDVDMRTPGRETPAAPVPSSLASASPEPMVQEITSAQEDSKAPRAVLEVDLVAAEDARTSLLDFILYIGDKYGLGDDAARVTDHPETRFYHAQASKHMKRMEKENAASGSAAKAKAAHDRVRALVQHIRRKLEVAGQDDEGAAGVCEVAEDDLEAWATAMGWLA